MYRGRSWFLIIKFGYNLGDAVHMFCQQREAHSHHAWGTECHYEPILDGGSGVFAAAHSDHDDGEEEEEAGHGEAHAVHGLVAHNDVTVDLVLYARYTGATDTETWYLANETNAKETFEIFSTTELGLNIYMT